MLHQVHVRRPPQPHPPRELLDATMKFGELIGAEADRTAPDGCHERDVHQTQDGDPHRHVRDGLK